ncbi:transposase, partial [Enterococcus faecalis]
MAKYSFEFKLKLVHDYLSGQESLRFLAKKYGITTSSCLV